MVSKTDRRASKAAKICELFEATKMQLMQI
jgi:hypothetical protein